MPTTTYTHAFPCFHYADARAAIDWLVRAFGAEPREVFDGPDGKVMHAEVWFGPACVMMGTVKGNGYGPSQPGQCLAYIVVSDPAGVDALHDRAVAAGAKIVISLRDTDYGSHDFACHDPEGNFWSFGTYAPK